LMPMVLAELPAAGKPPRIFNVPTLVDEVIRFVDALLDGGAPGPASALLLRHQPAPATRPLTPWDQFAYSSESYRALDSSHEKSPNLL